METPPDKSLRLASAVFGAGMIGFGAISLVLLAAALLAVMFGSWVVMLHAPRVIAAQGNKNEWTSLFVAVAMCGGSWIVSRAVASRTH